MSKKNKKLNNKAWHAWDYGMVAASIFMILLVIYPLWYVIINAISDPKLVEKGWINWWPVDPDFLAFQTIMSDINFYRAIGVTLYFAAWNIVLTNVANLFMAYPLARRNLKGRKFLVAFLIGSNYFGGSFIPQFLLLHKLGLYNTPWAIILPYACVSMGLTALYMTFIRAVAMDLMDAAALDGASNVQTLLRVVVPQLKPAIAVNVFQMIIGNWNTWFGINLYLPDRKWQNVQIYLSRLLDGMMIYNPDEMADLFKYTPEQIEKMKENFAEATRVRYASILLVALPLLILYPFVQKNLAQGIMVGSLKG